MFVLLVMPCVCLVGDALCLLFVLLVMPCVCLVGDALCLFG